jgi:hypothetical protein
VPELSFVERLSLLIDQQWNWRENQALARRLKSAKLRHMKDSLWSLDLFRCELATLRTHWVLVVMDQYTRRIIGFGVHAGTVNGVALCWMFHRAFDGNRGCPSTSVPTMIPFFGLGSGKPICGYWR